MNSFYLEIEETTQVYFQIIEQKLVLMLLHISLANHNHLQGATNVEEIYRIIKTHCCAFS
jgi:hypothetical protein